MTRLSLRRGHDRRVRGGHPWVFSNEIASLDGPATPGLAVEVFTADGQRLGTGYYNPHSLIAVRILTHRDENIDNPGFYIDLLKKALEYRRSTCGDLDSLRLVHGESDGLPGLVVDRYADVLCVQLLTLGMETRREAVVAALLELFGPRAIVGRNDSASRELEGLPRTVELLHGKAPAEHRRRFGRRDEISCGTKLARTCAVVAEAGLVQGQVHVARKIDPATLGCDDGANALGQAVTVAGFLRRQWRQFSGGCRHASNPNPATRRDRKGGIFEPCT